MPCPNPIRRCLYVINSSWKYIHESNSSSYFLIVHYKDLNLGDSEVLFVDGAEGDPGAKDGTVLACDILWDSSDNGWRSLPTVFIVWDVGERLDGLLPNMDLVVVLITARSAAVCNKRKM